MENVAPPVVRSQEQAFVIELGPDFSHLHENMLEHLTLVRMLAASCDPPNIVLDMRNVQFIGSALIGFLVSVSQKLSARNGKLLLANPNAFCRTAIQVVNLDSILPTFESVDAAIQAR